MKLHNLIYQAAGCVACQRGLAERHVREWGQIEGAERSIARGWKREWRREGADGGAFKAMSHPFSTHSSLRIRRRMLPYAEEC